MVLAPLKVPSRADDILTIADVIEPIVSEAEWRAAQPGRTASRPGPRPDRPTERLDMRRSSGRYALRGLLILFRMRRRKTIGDLLALAAKVPPAAC